MGTRGGGQHGYLDTGCEHSLTGHNETNGLPMSRAFSDTYSTSTESQTEFGNRLLDSLPAEACIALRPHLRIETLAVQDVLAESGGRAEQAYFPIDCVASLVTVMRDGSGVEVGLIGCDGMLPVSIVLGDAVPAQRTIVLVAGTALAINLNSLRRLMDAHPAIGRMLLCYAQATLNQAAQLAACNRLHLLEERCARWLLMAHDRVRRNDIHVTHEMLATTLGVRRPGVTVAAQALQAKGSIAYRHGTVFVLDRKLLEAAACECYAAITADYARLIGEPALSFRPVVRNRTDRGREA